MDYIVFDTETTGLVRHQAVQLKDQPHVIEFAGIRLKDVKGKLKEVKRLNFLCKPPVQITEEITKITGITQKMVEKEKSFKAYASPLVQFFQASDVAIAHNFSFDEAMINFEFRRIKIPWIWPKRCICTVEATEYVKSRRMKLQELHEHLFGEAFSGAHRAMTDVEALARCVIKLNEEGVIS